MEIEPTYRIQPADPAAEQPPLSLGRLGRFFLLAMFGAAVVDFNIPLLDIDGWVSSWLLDYRFSASQAEAVALIIIAMGLTLAIASATTLLIDGLSFFRPWSALRRWATRGYWGILILAGIVALFLFYVRMQDPCAGPRLCPYIG